MEGYMLQGVGKDGASSSCDIRIRTHPCKITDIRTISAEKDPKATKLMTNLLNIIEFKSGRLEAMESKYMETRDIISKLVAEYDELHQAYYEEIKEMQFSIREHFQWLCNDHELMNLKLERQEKELELRGIELQKREVINENKRKKLAEEIKESAAKKSSLDEQRKANKRMMTLADDYKKEKEKLQEEIFFLENQLNEKQALEAEIESLMRQLNVVKHTGDDDSEVMKKLEEIKKNIKEKEEELEDLKDIYQTLIVKEWKSNDELQEARKELIEGFKQLPKSRHIGVKRIGELENKPFYEAMELKYNKNVAKDKALEVCSLWEVYIRDPNWHPFKLIIVDGILQENIDEDDEKLKSLRRDMGEKVYNAVTNALREINDYNPSGSYVISELWNFNEAKKATLKEGVSYLLKIWDAQKRRKRA